MKKIVYALLLGAVMLLNIGCMGLSNDIESESNNELDCPSIHFISFEADNDHCIRLFVPTITYAAFRYLMPDDTNSIIIQKNEYENGVEKNTEMIGTVDIFDKPDFRGGYIAVFESTDGAVCIKITSHDEKSTVVYEQEMPEYSGTSDQSVYKDTYEDVVRGAMYPLYFSGAYDEELVGTDKISGDISSYRNATVICIAFQ